MHVATELNWWANSCPSSIVRRDASFKLKHTMTLPNTMFKLNSRTNHNFMTMELLLYHDTAIGCAHARAFHNHFGSFGKVFRIFCTLHDTRNALTINDTYTIYNVQHNKSRIVSHFIFISTHDEVHERAKLIKSTLCTKYRAYSKWKLAIRYGNEKKTFENIFICVAHTNAMTGHSLFCCAPDGFSFLFFFDCESLQLLARFFAQFVKFFSAN